MGVELLTLLLFASMILLLITGLPVLFVMGSVSVLFAYFLIGQASLNIMATSMYGLMNQFVLIAIPLFVFMANIMERSNIAEDLYTMMYKWFGQLRGGLAMGTVLICTIFAAMSGISAAAVVTMSLIALPSMVKRGYDKQLALGTITGSAGLGQLIPPSLMMIVWALWAEESVGQMFLGGVLPGLIQASGYLVYISVRCFFNMELGPAIPTEEMPSWREKIMSLKAVIFPIFIILGVLGSIFSGMATPTEAAAIGVICTLFSAAISRTLTWSHVKNALYSSMHITGMIMWIVVAGACFSSVFTIIGAQEFITGAIQGIGVNRWMILIGIQVILLFLGTLLDPNAIMMLSIPIFVPIVRALGFDSLWFGVVSVMNIETGLVTPPFGMNLFYVKGITYKDTSMMEIYRSVIPFIVVQVLNIALCMVFPRIITFLPDLVIGK